MISIVKVLLTFIMLSSIASGQDKLRIGCLKGGIGADIFFEILNQACQQLSIKCKRIAWPSERTLAKTQLNKIDGDGPRNPAIEKYYPKLVRVDFNFFDVEFVGFSADVGISLKTWKDLEKYRFSYLRGWKIFDLNTPKKNRRLFDTPDGLIKNLLSPSPKRHTQIFLLTKWDGFDLIGRYKAKDKIKLVPGVLGKRAQFFYLSPQNKHLATKFAEVLNRMKSSGQLKKIINKTLKKRLGFVP